MIEIKLGTAQYDFSAMDENGIAPIRNVWASGFNAQQESRLQELGVQLGPFQPGGETKVVLYSHLRAKVRDSGDSEWFYQNADLLIRVSDDDRKRVSGVTLGEETAYQKFVGKKADCYVPPRHWKAVQGKYQDAESSHYTVAGTEKVYVHYTDGMKDVISVTSKPSIEAQDYQAMINDLYAISSELLTDTEAHTKVSIGDAQHNQLQNMQKLVSRIENAWIRLRGNMEQDLTPEYVKMSVDRIKNMTVKSLLEYRFTGNPNVHAVKYKETRNIYENRMILQFFNRMEAYLKRQKASALQSITHEGSGYLDDFQEAGSDRDREKLKKIRERLQLWHFDTVKNEILTNTVDHVERYQIQQGDTEVVEKENFLLSLENWFPLARPEWDVGQKRPKDVTAENGIDLDWQYINLYPMSFNKDDNRVQSGVYGAMSRKRDEFGTTRIRVSMKNYKLLRFLYYVASEAQRYAAGRNLCNGNDCVCLDINGSVELVDSARYEYSNFNTHDLLIYISKINTVTVREKGVNETMTFTYSETEDYLEYGSAVTKMLLRDFVKSAGGLNAMSIGQLALAIDESGKKQWQQEHAEEFVKQQSQKWDALIKRMEKLGDSKELSHIPLSRENLRCTNIFASNSKYHAMYQLMRQASEFAQEIYYDEMDDIPILKLEQLYERWCLVKLLHIFVSDYGFEFLDDTGKGNRNSSKKQLYKYISQLLKNGTFKDSVFRLKGRLYDVSRKMEDDEMQVDIYYNHEFILGDNVDWTEDMIPEGGRPKQKLIPDFYVRMTYGGQTKHFCLDAKYRTRNNLTGENGSRRWYSDLMTVALQKYIVELSQVQPIDGSFILHSNAYSCVGKWAYQDRNPHAYCGQRLESLWAEYNKYLTVPSDVRDMLISEQARRFFTENAQGDFYEEEDGPVIDTRQYINDNRIGSYYLLPGKDIYLRVWITMIMEHYFGVYDAMCWDCGHRVKIGDIAYKNTEHYVVNCPECGTVWVRNFCTHDGRPIGKHIINYYAMADGGNKWNRVCPKCHGGWKEK